MTDLGVVLRQSLMVGKGVAEKKTEVRKLYLFCTTCPKCAKYYGKNYVVLPAQV
jgi:hypothetical protein